jgi:hypothetical protein
MVPLQPEVRRRDIADHDIRFGRGPDQDIVDTSIGADSTARVPLVSSRCARDRSSDGGDSLDDRPVPGVQASPSRLR